MGVNIFQSKRPLLWIGRLYYVENSFLEVIKVKDLQKLPGPKKIFPLSIMMQEPFFS